MTSLPLSHPRSKSTKRPESTGVVNKPSANPARPFLVFLPLCVSICVRRLSVAKGRAFSGAGLGIFFACYWSFVWSLAVHGEQKCPHLARYPGFVAGASLARVNNELLMCDTIDAMHAVRS